MTASRTRPQPRAQSPSRLIYLHGFRSSPQSFKAKMLAARLASMGRAADFVCPQLPISPRAAWHLILDLQPTADDVVIGSSLGGFYARALASKIRALTVIALNPAVDPAASLARHLGMQRGWHDDAPLEFLPHYLDELRDLYVEQLETPERCLVVAARGDELLDWREMVARWQGSRILVLEASDHGITDFDRYIDTVLDVAGFGRPALASTPMFSQQGM